MISSLTAILDWLLCLSIQDLYHLFSLPLAGFGIYLLSKRARSASDQVKISEADSLSNRYQRAAEMIDSERRSTRAAGFYSLKHLMHAHPAEFHVMAMELICMFLRNPPRPEGDDREKPLLGSHGRLREDMQAAMDVIGSRADPTLKIEAAARYIPHLGSVCLHRMVLEDVNLSSIILTAAILQEAKFKNNVNLSRAALDGGADLGLADIHGTNFSKASLEGADCTGAVFSSCQFIGSSLCRSIMKQVTFEDTNFCGADTDQTNFTGSRFDARCRISQRQLDIAIADPENVPALAEGMVDHETGLPLVWNTAHCGRQWEDSPL